MRVLIGTPTFEYHRHCFTEFTRSLDRQTERRFDVVLVDNSPTDDFVNFLREQRAPVFRTPFHPLMRERTTRARDMIRDMLLRGEYTHLLFLDQDVILPADGLARLLEHQLPIVSGVYCKEYDGDEYAMVVMSDWRERASGLKVTPIERLEGKRLFEIEAAGFGCLLIERTLAAEVPLRYTEEIGNDLAFSEDVRKLGERIFCDATLRCGHQYVVRDFERHPSWGRW